MPEKKLKDKFGKERVIKEFKQAVQFKMVQRIEGPLLGLIAFSITLWGSKLFTAISPGTSLYFLILGYEIHFHHFNYGLIAVAIGVIFTFFEGRWFARFSHILLGGGLGFVVDEYWLLLTFDATTYFGPQSQLISAMIGIFVTVLYTGVIIGIYFFTRSERKLWIELYEKVKSGEIDIDI